MFPAVAVKLADVAPKDTVTAAGTMNVAALLNRLISAPPVNAAFESVTEQVEVPPESRLVGEQENELIVGLTNNEIEVLEELPLYEAVIFADPSAEMLPAVAVKLADVAPEDTVTVAG